MEFQIIKKKTCYTNILFNWKFGFNNFAICKTMYKKYMYEVLITSGASCEEEEGYSKVHTKSQGEERKEGNSQTKS